MKSDRIKLTLSLLWFVMTFSMVTWWWIFSLRQLKKFSTGIPVGIPTEEYESLHGMLLWEGSFLLAFIFIGGSALLVLTNRERLRNLRLRLFFSNFSHDLKTSISRLRVRTEVLAQKNNNAELQELLDEASRLDLQLENSLWVARGEEQKLNCSEVLLGDVIGYLRVEWPHMEIHLQRDAKVLVDPTAIRSVFRNILQNASLHGEATRIDIQVEKIGQEQISMVIKDNGRGFSGNLSSLGKNPWPSTDREGTGIGLYLTQLLLEKMKGSLQFQTLPEGFQVMLKLKGSLT